MKDFVYIDEVPIDEPCAQVGSADYYHLAMIEIAVHKAQLIRQFGNPPDGSYFKTTPNAHDAGTYYILNYIFDDEIESHMNYAINMENGLTKWDPESLLAIIEKDPHYFDMVECSNKIESPKLNDFVQQVMKIMNS